MNELLGAAARFGLLGESQEFQNLLSDCWKASQTAATTLIEGESGTGKEGVARLIHELSIRRHGPFIAVNCGAIPEALVESELFGHVRGSFSGAHEDRIGLFEACHTGTLFLDEVGELSAAAQVRLLRVLQSKEIRRVGSSRTLHVDTRVLAATHRNLPKMVHEGTFRTDLFYRLHVMTVEVPALRRRKGDIPLLVRHFVDLYSELYGLEGVALLPADLMLLERYEWPGNIRELQNTVERAVLCAKNERGVSADGVRPRPNRFLKFDHIQPVSAVWQSRSSGTGDSVCPFDAAKQDFERQYMLSLMRQVGGNISEAARVAGKFRSDIYRMLERTGLSHLVHSHHDCLAAGMSLKSSASKNAKAARRVENG